MVLLLCGLLFSAFAEWPRVALDLPIICVFRLVSGIPCPFCGMTHDFVRLVNHEVPWNRPGTLLVGLSGVVYVAQMSVSVAVGTDWSIGYVMRRCTLITLVVCVWILNLAYWM
jgi:hypothetical protein